MSAVALMTAASPAGAGGAGERGGRQMDWSSYSRPSREELKKVLTPLQYEVTQEDGTDTAYRND